MQPNNNVIYTNKLNKKSTRSKVIMVFICLLVLAMVFVIGSFLIPKKTNSLDVSKNFVSYIAKNDAAKAYDLLSDKTQSKEVFKKNFADPLRLLYNLDNCKFAAKESSLTIIACPVNSSSNTMVLNIETTKVDGKLKIKKYVIK